MSEDDVKKRITIPKIEINVHKIKLVFAVLMLIAEVVAMLGSVMRGLHAGAITLVLFAIITYDYIRILRTDAKSGPWYELEDIEESE